LAFVANPFFLPVRLEGNFTPDRMSCHTRRVSFKPGKEHGVIWSMPMARDTK